MSQVTRSYWGHRDELLTMFRGASYGLILDSTFSRNSSSTSPAYNNEVLCASDGVFSEKARQFECLGVEIWGTQA